MDITRFAIENNRVTIVALLCICAAGYGAYRSMPQAEDPGFTIRTAVVVTYLPGANPERVENLVSDKIESAVQEIAELDTVRSQSTTGVSVVHVDIKEEFRDMRPIWDNLRRKVEKARANLPDGYIGPFVNDEFGDTFGTIVAVSGDGYSYAELKDVADQVRDLILRLDDVGKVEIYGKQDERIFVEYDNAKLAEVGLSIGQLQQQLQARNILIPGGSLKAGLERIELEPTGSFVDVADLASTVIRVPGREQLLYLEDLAEVRRGYVDPPVARMRATGAPALGLAVSVKDGGNIVRLGEELKSLIDRLQQDMPIGLDLSIVAFQPEVVDRKVQDFVGNVVQAIVIVMAAMLLMLGFRTGLVVASLIPSAMLMSLMVMNAIGIGLNQMSLAALIIALGMLVDNAIVMSESIMVLMAAGRSAVDAAVDSARELRIPLLTSSLTTAAAFLPIYLAESTVGEYTSQLFSVVTITLLSSWILALTIVPLFCVMFLRVQANPETETFDSRLYRTYRGLLLLVVRRPLVSFAATAAIFFLSLQGFRYIPNIFFPPSDKAMFTTELEAPVGTDISRTERIVADLEYFVDEELRASEDRPGGITTWSAYVGQGAPRFTLSYSPEQVRPEYAYVIFNTASADSLPELQQRIAEFCDERFPDVRATVKLLQNGPIIKNPVEVRLMGDDVDELFAIVDQVKEKLSGTPGARNVGDDWGARTKKLVVDVDNARARRAGLSNQDVAVSLLSTLSGYEATDYREGDTVIPVTLRSTAENRQNAGRIETLNVYSQTTGRSVPLQAVADLRLDWQPSKIFRRDRLKAVTVYSSVAPGVTAQSIAQELETWLAEQSKAWPLGYQYELGGEMEASGKGNQSIAEKLPIAGLIILLLLVGQFNSVRRPAIILLTIPLGLIGVVAGLLIADSYFGFMTLLGVISLAGIVINNAIVLLDRINIEINDNGLAPAAAVIEAAQRRLRPILLTTVTTVGGLIPLWLGGGVMFEPMAVAILFGLIFATALTLGVVPVLYTLLFRVSFEGFQYSPQS